MIKFNNTCDQEGEFNPRNLSNHNPTSRGYSGFRNPRIVRVSRDYGGKDRHSKVWTVKGLKDRRIRLSIPTAIQLYHLQDQLGLSQPSKVIDWLLDVTKEDIDKLPPLQMAVEDFNRFHIPSSFVLQNFNSTQLSFSPFASPPNYDHQRTKGKQIENKSNSYNYNEFQPSYNLSLSRFGLQLDTYNASLLPSSLTSQSEPQVSSLFGTASPSFSPPHLMHNQFQLSTSNSPNMSVPLNLNDTRAKVLFGLHMNCMASSGSNDIGL